jgi:hypothetical protein
MLVLLPYFYDIISPYIGFYFLISLVFIFVWVQTPILLYFSIQNFFYIFSEILDYVS